MSLNLHAVTSRDDPRIAPYTAVRERDLTGRDGLFLVEGKVTLEVCITRARFDLDSVFLEEGRVPVLAELLEKLPDSVPIYTAPQSLMDQIAGFPIHRGILACARNAPETDFGAWLSAQTGATTLALCIGTSNHDNVGAVFRNCAALGADGVVLDETSCDPLYRKAIRVSAGTALWLPYYHGGSGETLLDTLKDEGWTIWTLTPGETATNLYKTHRPDRLCLVLGPEGPGLSDALLARGERVRIPMANAVDSLNVATSLAIALSHRLSG